MIFFERLSLNFHFIFVFSQAGNRRVKLCVLTNFFFCHSRINGVQSKHENKTDKPKKIKIKISNANVLQHSASRIISLEFNKLIFLH